MIAMTMSENGQCPRNVGRHVKIFLQCCQNFSVSYWTRNVEPFWATTGNYPSLLNLEEQIINRGCCRWWWEGTRERFIQTVKEVLVSLRTTSSYYSKKLVLVQKLTVMSWIRKQLAKRIHEKKEYKSMYHRYDSLDTIENLFKKGRIISTFTMNGYINFLFVAYGKKRDKMSILGMSLNQFDQKVSICGMTYGKITYDITKVVENKMKEDIEDNIQHFCILLPQPKKSLVLEQKFAVVYDDWDVLEDKGRFGKVIPGLCKNLFSEG